MKTNPRLMLPLVAGALAATLALPAGAGAAKGIRIQPSGDPLAPSGQTPIVLFHVTGLTKGRRYVLHAEQKRGQAPYREGAQGPERVCTPLLGNGLAFNRARKTSLDWDTRPGFFRTQPSLIESSYGAFAPCRGTYAGRLEVKQRSGTRTLVRFTVTVPGLRLRYVALR